MILAALGWGASTQAQLTLDWFTIDAGGHTFSTGAGYSLGGTCGQPDAGTVSGSTYTLAGGFWIGGTALSAVPESPDVPDVPETLRIVAGLKNPFVDETGIQLMLPAAVSVEVRVFDHSGRLIRQLYSGVMQPGRHRLSWNGVNSRGQRVASGAYLVDVRAGEQRIMRRVVFLQ
jgi:hypothetical protein